MRLGRTILGTLGALALWTLSACAASDSADTSGQNASDITAAEGPYPIVLAHGFFGFKTFAGLDFFTYFFGVEADLKAHGEPNVFTPAVDPFNDSTTRGKQLEAKILEILKQTGAKKVNIIGHSQGGLDARVVAHDRPDLVASVTTISSPHLGGHTADVVLGATEIPGIGNVAGAVTDSLVQLIGAPIWDELGKDTSVTRAVRQVSTEGMRHFNEQYPNDPSVKYFSLAGRTGFSDSESVCRPDGPTTFMAKWGRLIDTTDLLLKLPELVTSGRPFRDEANDGFVRVAEARWGTFLGCIPADHLDEVGQLFADKPGLGNDFDHFDFYRSLVAHLRAQGL
jgi:triacylglycerol lipase